MNFDAFRVRRVQNRSEPVEFPVVAWVFYRRLKRLSVERVSTPPYLHNQRVDVGALRICDQLRHLL